LEITADTCKAVALVSTLQAGEDDDQDELDKFSYDVGLEYDWSVRTVQVYKQYKYLWYQTLFLSKKNCLVLTVPNDLIYSTNKRLTCIQDGKIS
jgi:hypothetical protein